MAKKQMTGNKQTDARKYGNYRPIKKPCSWEYTELKEARMLVSELTCQLKKCQATEGIANKQIVSLEKMNCETAAQLAETEAKYQALAKSCDEDIQKAVREARSEVAAKYKGIITQVKAHLKGKNAAAEVRERLAQRTANLELLDEIIDGEMTDYEAKREEVSEEEIATRMELNSISIPELDFDKLGLSGVTQGWNDSDDELMMEWDLEVPQGVDEYGSNEYIIPESVNKPLK